MYQNILIVEDDLITRFLIKRILMEMEPGFNQIYEAVNGKKGLEILQRFNVDLILTDINMPVMDGLEMLGRIRSNPEYKDIPVVVITSKMDEKLERAITESGLGYVNKPFTGQILKKEILNLKENKDVDLEKAGYV